MPNLTIRDIAKMAGVSTTAVSFVLNDRPGVSDATRAHVRAIIERTGFTPNVHTRRLNLGKSQTVHVVMRKHENGLFGQFAQETLQGIFKASHALGYSITFTFADRDAPCEQLIAMVHGKDCDGLILYQVSDSALIARLRQEQIPFVCVDAHLAQDGSLPLVEVDYYNAARQATQYLCQCGHREIGFIGTQVPNTYYMNTFGGYMDALKAFGLEYNPAWMLALPNDAALTSRDFEPLLREKRLPTAFFCAGDAFAIPAMRAVKERGLKIPDDVSFMSLDDLLVSRYLDPPLSTMTFDKERLGAWAMELLYKMLQNEPCDRVNLLPTRVAPRATVRDLSKTR